jgi:hypothetical protein
MSVPSRVLFRERQLLRASDLLTEQQYLLGLAGRHHVAPHTWGIVRGLSISLQNDVATVQPGLAIDGYGRELAVFQPARLTFSPQHSAQYVYLYYCERPRGACGPAPNPRFRDSAEMQVTATAWPIPSNDPDLTAATAAGGVVGAVPWPVLLGIIKARKNNIFHVHYSHCIYTRLRASLICSPAGGTVVHVGAENLADPYDLRISLRDAGRNLQRRFAIDRDGNAIFWGNLILTSAQRGLVLSTQIESVFLKAQVKPGVGGAVRVQSSFTRGARSTLTLRFRVKTSAQGAVADDVLQIESSFTAKQLKEAIKNFNRKSSSVNLKELVDLNPPKRIVAPRSRMAGPPPAKASVPIFDDRDLPIDFAGADLSFVPEDVAAALPCDCRTPVDNPELLPEGFIFLPGTAAPAPPSRDIYSLHLEPQDQLPSDEVRISGGAKKDGDFSRRICVSGQDQNGFIPLLAFRGNGSLALPGDLSSGGAQSHLLCVVGGAAQLPIVKPDPRDQLFNSLLILAFTHGVLSLSSSVLKLSIPSLPFVESAQDWTYNLTLQNLSTTDALKAKSSSEILWTDKLASPGSLQNIPPSIAPNTSTTVAVQHAAADLPDRASQLVIEVVVAMILGTAPTAGRVVTPPNSITVHTSPSADFLNLTDPVATNTQFAISVVNGSDLDFTVTAASLTLPAGPAQDLLGAHPPVAVASGQSQPLPVKGRVTVGPAPHVQFTLKITYHWTSGGAPNNNRTLSFSKTVTVN